MNPDIEVNLNSLNNNASLLMELAGALGAGRPDEELSRRACVPASPQDVSDEVRNFAAFAADQYLDLVALLAALSTRLRGASNAYAASENSNSDAVSQFLTESQYIPPSP
jgi:hypothetical protein